MVKLAIILGTYNRLPRLKQCLKSLLGNIKADHQILILDAGSSDETVKFIHKLKGNIKLVQDKIIGQAKSFNKILNKLNSKYVCWLSDDNQVRKGMLDLAVSILEENNDIGMVGLKVKDVSGLWVQEPYIGGIWPSGILNVNQGLIRTKLMRQVNCFDQSYPDYGMDSDLTTKVLLAGYKVVYTRKVAILHQRDYVKFPGTISEDDRKRSLEKAIKIYRRKYNKLSNKYELMQKIYLKNFLTLYQFLIELSYRFAKGRGISLDKILGYNQRDWRNVLEGRFISIFDLWYNRKKKYYLVQKMQ